MVSEQEKEMISYCQKKLIEWSDEYSVSHYPLYASNITCSATLAGDCSYVGTEPCRFGSIRVHYCLWTHPILLDGVLWHEFCHHWQWADYGVTGHGMKWRELRMRNIRMAMADTIASFVFPLIRK